MKVEAYQNGDMVATQTVGTAGDAGQITLQSDRKAMETNKRDVAHIEARILDDKNTLVPHAADTIHFDIEGPAKLLGVENGDILDLFPHHVSYRKAFKGKCLLVIQAKDQAGVVSIKATANGLKSSKIDIEVQ